VPRSNTILTLRKSAAMPPQCDEAFSRSQDRGFVRGTSAADAAASETDQDRRDGRTGVARSRDAAFALLGRRERRAPELLARQPRRTCRSDRGRAANRARAGPPRRAPARPARPEGAHGTVGSTFTLTTEPDLGDAEHVGVSYGGLARDVEVGKRIYLADGSIALRVAAIDGPRIRTVVEVGGELREKQGINYPDGTLELDAVTDRDLEHLDFGMAHDVDWVAVSFVRTAADVARVKEHISAAGR
jgi:hypothetical protein